MMKKKQEEPVFSSSFMFHFSGHCVNRIKYLSVDDITILSEENIIHNESVE